jgi:hypothetical protein
LSAQANVLRAEAGVLSDDVVCPSAVRSNAVCNRQFVRAAEL